MRKEWRGEGGGEGEVEERDDAKKKKERMRGGGEEGGCPIYFYLIFFIFQDYAAAFHFLHLPPTSEFLFRSFSFFNFINLLFNSFFSSSNFALISSEIFFCSLSK